MASGETVRILRVAAGGEGVGRLENGLTVFVPRTAPGDLVGLGSIDRYRRFARGTIDRLVEAGPDRVAPRCRHYDGDRCGGCQLQHLNASAQLTTKRAIVGDALRRIGHLETGDPEIVPAVEVWGYRTKITLASDVSGKRIGFHQIDRPGRVFELDSCEIAHPALDGLWRAVRAERHLLPHPVEHLVLRLDRAGGRHVLVEGRRPEAWTKAKALASALEGQGTPATVWWKPPEGAARIMAGDPDAFRATVFEQINPAMGDLVRRQAVAALEPVAAQIVWDLYAGIGETSDLLVDRGARVESIELDPDSVDVADRRAPTRPETVRRLVGRAEERVGELGRPDLVVTNPPRGGMDGALVDAIRTAGPRRMAYISCDPATLARDLARLTRRAPETTRLEVSRITAFDLFPQTAHVETLTVLERQ